MRKFKFGLLSKISFFVKYLFYKIFLFRDVKTGLLALYLAESVWLLNKIFKIDVKLPQKFMSSYYETIFGKFHITPDLLSMIAVSPAFEREDVEYLLGIMGKELSSKKKLLFLDIGAYFGLYTVAVGNKFKQYTNLEIIAFEPGTDYLSLPTFDLLRKNIAINHINRVKLKRIGIGSRKHVNKFGMKIDTLDSILGQKYLKNFDEIFIKMDIDDFVIDGLKGILKSTEIGKKVYLLVEDFVKLPETVSFLEKNKFQFITKISSYNSFWVKE